MHVLDRPIRRLARSRLVAAATWPHGIDRYAELVAPAWSAEGIRARIVGLRRQTADTVTVTLRPNGNWTGHRPGQHVLLTVEIDGARQTRCFSVASSARHRSTIELTCKASATSVVSRWLRDTAALGAVVEISEPRGDFVLADERPRPLALVSAGSGITPVLSMLRTLDDDAHSGEVVFVHYARGADDLLYTDELRSIADRRPGVRVVIVTEHDDAGDLTGRFEPSHLDAAGVDVAQAELFVCGPAPFMDALAAAWSAAGGPMDRFHLERFGPAPSAAPAGAASGGTIRFARSGLEVVDDGRPILEQAEAAGLTPAHGCRMGICHTCVVPKTAGCVRDAVTGDLDPAPAAGTSTTVRICVSVAAGDVELDL